jgi:predicted RNA-binding Zn-ribbon protein involved in translation (DUF1610 family)
MVETKIGTETRAQIIDKVIRVLALSHRSEEKRRIYDGKDRLNFACPYCGDSTTDERKKRGNVYWNDLYYHCYNCGAHEPLNRFLGDFDQEFEGERQVEIINYIKENRKHLISGGSLSFHLFDKLEELAPTKEQVMTGFNAYSINENTHRAYPYLKSRLLHRKLESFAYNPRRVELLVFNFTAGGKIAGFQVRSLSGDGPKYKTWNFERMCDRLGIQHGIELEELDQINKISMVFGIMQLDMSRDFNIFEGPIDAMFMHNSVGMTGVKKQILEFNEIPTARYFFDSDVEGKRKLIERLKDGQQVFMWRKFFDDYSIRPKKVKDLNDLVLYEYKNRVNCLSNLSSYFTSDPLDIIFI